MVVPGPRRIHIGAVEIANDAPMTLISGPCQIESRGHAMACAGRLVEICAQAGLGLVFKSSFDKANRTSIHSRRGVGIDEGLSVLADIRDRFGCPVLTDVHLPDQCAAAAEAVDVLQIPAFLCRQTDLVVAAAETGRPLNIKKGQFLAPWDMANVVAKAEAAGNRGVMVCERGACFGYNTLVSDMRALPRLAETGCPVVYDATHSAQRPGGLGGKSGGERESVPPLARAAVAVGVAAVFMETHPDPDNAPSDGPVMLRLDDLPTLLQDLAAIDRLIKPPIRSGSPS